MIRILLIWFILSFSIHSGHAQETRLVLPIGHTDFVTSIKFDRDDRRFLTLGFVNSTAKVWDLEKGYLLFDLINDGMVLSSNFSPDGKRIVTTSGGSTGGRAGTAKIWDSQNGNFLFGIASKFPITYAEFSPDNKKIILISENSAKIFDAIKGSQLFYLNDSTYNSRYHPADYKISSAKFSPDGKKILTANRYNIEVNPMNSKETVVRTWNADNGNLILRLIIHQDLESAIEFSPDGRKILCVLADSSVRVFDVSSGQQLLNLNKHNGPVSSATFSPDGTKILTASKTYFDETYDQTIGEVKVWSADSGSLSYEIRGIKTNFKSPPMFSPDGIQLLVGTFQGASVWRAEDGIHIFDINEPRAFTNTKFSQNGKKIVISTYDNQVKVWNSIDSKFIATAGGHCTYVESSSFSPDGAKIITKQHDYVKVWDAINGKMLSILKHQKKISSALFSSDNKKILTASYDGTSKLWNATTGNLLLNLPHDSSLNCSFYCSVMWASFSSDEKKIFTSSLDGSVRIWDAASGKLLTTMELRPRINHFAIFSPDGTKILNISEESNIEVWNVETKKVLFQIQIDDPYGIFAEFSPDGKKVLIETDKFNFIGVCDSDSGKGLFELKIPDERLHDAHFVSNGKMILAKGSDRDKIYLLDAFTGKLQQVLTGDAGYFISAESSHNGKRILTIASDYTVDIWDTQNGKRLWSLKSHSSAISSAYFSADDEQVLTSSDDATSKIWDVKTGQLKYTFFEIDSSDYLIVDKDFRFDGTPAARKMLYFTCGSEVIDLEQLKESLWVPDLAERINRGEPINNKKLSELNICGLTPTIKVNENSVENYSFTIIPGKGGLGETNVLVNGTITERYKPDQLKKVKEGYLLSIPKSKLAPYLIKGKDNPIVVKSYTSDNTITSRGLKIEAQSNSRDSTPPNLYAVVVGISNYKGEKLDLNYADKDAQEIGNAIKLASKKYLNSDGREHVFLYSLKTDTPRHSYPDKSNIQHIFDTIAKQAMANDILLIFFAGHGVVEGETKKQFYFLTSEASSFTNVESVGISIQELIDWIKPEKIKAQKRILIIDACNSAAAINEISKNEELIAVRNTSSAEEKKEIERLNDQAGLYVLSASASNQSAYEFARYSQGLLTYTLLRAIKQQPDILENNKYLNLSNWFKAAKKSVGEILTQSGNSGRQEPQVLVNTDFNIGIVDQEVIDKIQLADEKPIFTRSEFRNTINRVDNLKLRPLVDKQITDHSRGVDNKLLYQGDYEGSEAYSFSGDYTVSGNDISVSVFLIKGGTEIINKSAWVFKGKTDQLESLAAEIVKKGIANLPKK